jgi:PrcB C-terminal
VFVLLMVALLQSQQTFRTIGKGPMSGIDASRQVVVRTAADWTTLWRLHAPGGQPMPAVDFSRETVVGVFAGTRPTSGYGVEIVRATDANGTLTVDYVETRPAPGAVTAQIVTTPYHLVAVPKHDGEVRFQDTGK